jgi:hypothetical protein
VIALLLFQSSRPYLYKNFCIIFERKFVDSQSGNL